MTSNNPEAEAIRDVIDRITRGWLSKQYDEIGAHVAADAVVAPPGTTARVIGRDAYVRSYREYDAAATTHELRADPPQIDVIGDVAVAVCPFWIHYELQGQAYRESGKELLVFRRFDGKWQVVWRTMQTDRPGPGGE